MEIYGVLANANPLPYAFIRQDWLLFDRFTDLLFAWRLFAHKRLNLKILTHSAQQTKSQCHLVAKTGRLCGLP